MKELIDYVLSMLRMVLTMSCMRVVYQLWGKQLVRLLFSNGWPGSEQDVLVCIHHPIRQLAATGSGEARASSPDTRLLRCWRVIRNSREGCSGSACRLSRLACMRLVYCYPTTPHPRNPP